MSPTILLAQEPCLLEHPLMHHQLFQEIHNVLEEISNTWIIYEFSVVWFLVDYPQVSVFKG